MKNKPLRHKKENTFRFKPFSERINEIDIDVFHRVSHRNGENEDEIETYFHEALQKWNVLNLTEGYNNFKKKVRDIVTLPQLLNKKQYVIDVLKDSLKEKNILYLQPLLELVVAVAKDLQKEFYEYFPDFLPIIIDLLKTKDAEQIEYTFATLAYMFKFLWRYLVKNVPAVFNLLLPLLADTQPEYINNFAAESFAFVVRKVKDKRNFLKLVLYNLKDDKSTVSGCGKLLFEVISGVPGQFHSCAEQMLTIYFDALYDETIDQKTLYKVLKVVTEHITINIQPQKSIVFWNILLAALDTSKENDNQLQKGKKGSLSHLLNILQIVITHKNGRMLVEPNALINKLASMIDIYKSETDLLGRCINVSVDILLASTVKLTQEISSKLVLKIVAVQDVKILCNSMERLIKHSAFETLILPQTLQNKALQEFDIETLRLYAKIIKDKAPPCLNGMKLNEWKKFNLDIPQKNIPEILRPLSFENTISCEALRSLIIVPHLRPRPKELDTILRNGILQLYSKLMDSEENNIIADQFSFAFLLALESCMHVLEPIALHDLAQSLNMIDLFCKHKSNIWMLSAMDMWLSYFSATEYHAKYITEVALEALNECLAEMLGSPIHYLRLTAAHICSLFSEIFTVSSENTGKDLMKLMYLAECESATVHEYRNRLLHLQGLEFSNCKISNINPKFYKIPIRYLMGNLYVNFSLLWEPVIKTLSTYASKECQEFWPLFLSELSSTAVTDVTYEPSFACDVISDLQMQIRRVDVKPDVDNYKILLWRCMAEFPSFCETKNRDLTEMFINFVKSHFFKSNSEDGKSCNIEKHKAVVEEPADSDEDEETENAKMEVEENAVERNAENQENEDSASKELLKSFAKSDKRQKTKLLLAQMELFARMTNPKMLYKEPEVRQIYMDLLSSKNPEIQKSALSCLCAYKYKYLSPYEDHLRSLISEKNLKNELRMFKIDKESKMVQEEHRADLMPILMRIVYSKMIVKTGMRTGGKGGGLVRRKAVLRFLAGAQEDEMITFVEMAFKPFQRYVRLGTRVPLTSLIDGVVDTLDLAAVIPPKRLQSATNLLGIITELFGGKMSTRLLPYLLAVHLCILALASEILRRSEEVHQGYLSSIKLVRTNCIGLLARFFAHFENYPWSADEIDALYRVAVFPWLEKLPAEGIHSPTALLRLFAEWSKNPRYYPLFVKRRADDETISPLPFVVRLLANPKTHPSVTSVVLEMIERLLTLRDYGVVGEEVEPEAEERGEPLTTIVTDLLPIREDVVSTGVNYGSTILLPHVPAILEYLRRRIAGPQRTMNRTELTILSRVSEFVTDAKTCDTLLVLTLPILTKRSTGSEETVLELMRTVTNLVERVERPEIHVRSIVPLLSSISSVPARKLLIKLLAVIAARSDEEQRPTTTRNYELIADLNAWDSRWIDQPDFQKRLDAFAKIRELADNVAITLEFGVAVIHTCFFYLRTESDLAMKDCAGQCLRAICLKLAREFKDDPRDRRHLMDETVLAGVRKSITSKVEALRLQSIGLLGHLARECPEVHPVLRDLNALTSKVDPEVDFFENMQHLQIHRKARALLKFCNVFRTLKKPPNPKTLTQYILPFASSFLCNAEHAGKNSVVDAAIETVGTVCRLLPWYHYEIILKYYLGKLRSSIEFQKQLVRLIVAILDSFHYDLSKCKAMEAATGPNDATLPKEEIVETEEPKEDSEEMGNLPGNDDQEMDEKLEEALDDDAEVPGEEVEEKDEEVKDEEMKDEEMKDQEVKEDLPAAEKQILLSQYGAKRVVFGISKGLLPQLHRAISARTRRDDSHKVNRKMAMSDHEEESLMRVPIALALVKLLQKLPKAILDHNLPGILMKLCTFLKSRLESVRRVTREILQKIMITLGPEYLPYLLKELNTLLTKGFQVHVLAYTIHSVLVALKPHFQPHQIDNNLQSILSVCKIDLFGFSAEEKDAAGILKNVAEAKSTKSYDVFHILAEFITESCMLDLILPLKEVLSRTHSHKTIAKIVECLRNVVLGLADNAYIPLRKMLVFLYGVVSELIPELLPSDKKKEFSEKESEALSRQNPDSFIIPPEPKNRLGIKAAAKTSKNTNTYVLIEFGLKLFHILLKRDKISDSEFAPLLDPFVPVLSNCLKSQHVKLCTLSLQCLNWILKMDLPSVIPTVPEICSSMFDILHRYAAAGLSKGDNFDLVMAAFKCMSVLIRDVKQFTVNNEQLKALILYAEQDLHDSDRHATAFTLLKAIISRKLIIPEMHPVLDKVANLSVASELEHVRLQSRSLFYTYLMEYPLGKRIDRYISFYLSQLSYEMQPGRLSALEMLHNIIAGFPLKVLAEQSGLMFLTMGARLVNDEDPTTRKLCAKYIKEMIIRLPQSDRSNLFDIVLMWMTDDKIMHRTLALQLCGIFVTVEKDGFESRLEATLPLLLKQFHAEVGTEDEPGRFVKIQKDPEPRRSKVRDPERMKDHHLFQALQLLLKLSVHCKAFLSGQRHKHSVRSFAEYVQSSLAHPHLWVRLAATQFVGFILSALDVNRVVELLNNPEACDAEDGYVYSDAVETLRSLTLDLIAQLHTDMEFEELADQVVKNLIFIAGIFKSLEHADASENGKADAANNLSLPWLVKKLRKCVNVEVTQAPKSVSVRTAVFKWIAGVVATVPMEKLKVVLPSLMSPLVREMSLSEEFQAPLKRLAKEVAAVVKKHVGEEHYVKLLNKAQQTLDIRRAERKKVKLQQFVTDPELAAKRKIARQQKKKEARKRKLDTIRGKPASKKRRKKESDLDVL